MARAAGADPKYGDGVEPKAANGSQVGDFYDAKHPRFPSPPGMIARIARLILVLPSTAGAEW